MNPFSSPKGIIPGQEVTGIITEVLAWLEGRTVTWINIGLEILGNEQAYDGGNNPIVVLTDKPDAPNDCWVFYFERAVAG